MEASSNGIIENIKERLTNPFLFTYFWVLITWNHKNLLLLFFEPKLFSTKMLFLSDWGTFFWPLVGTIAVLAIMPWLNIAIEYWKEKADNHLKSYLHNHKIKSFVDSEIHQKTLSDLRDITMKVSSAQANERAAREAYNRLNTDLINLQTEFNDQKDLLNNSVEEQKKLYKWADNSVYIFRSLNWVGSNDLASINTSFKIQDNPKLSKDEKSELQNTIVELLSRPKPQMPSDTSCKELVLKAIANYESLINQNNNSKTL